jgi:hypothetical protein
MTIYHPQVRMQSKQIKVQTAKRTLIMQTMAWMRSNSSKINKTAKRKLIMLMTAWMKSPSSSPTLRSVPPDSRLVPLQPR